MEQKNASGLEEKSEVGAAELEVGRSLFVKREKANGSESKQATTRGTGVTGSLGGAERLTDRPLLWHCHVTQKE